MGTNDRNATIAFVLGMLLLLGSIFGGAFTDTAITGVVGVIMIAGVLLIVLGIVFKGRRTRD